ncbi:tetratricopeptide repeat protein [Thioclava kandeliae]|uniref:Tetratricopeptide repeat protein n=1 Tax=Thioclava kandeliae TaxID=3070818 RepID=A0ABV1SM90_9RHOB
MKKVVLALALTLALAACDSAKDKAAKHYAAAQEYAEQGDMPRAMVELRNALQLDETLRDARLMYAKALLDRNQPAQAFAQYRFLFERDPKDAEAASAMAMIAFDAMGWDDAQRYSAAALEQDPSDKEMLAVKAGLDYRKASLNKDPTAQAAAASQASELIEADPTLIRARRVVVADAVQNGALDAALGFLDAGLKITPADRDLNNVRLVVLERLGRDGDVEAQIRAMVQQFPQDEDLDNLLVSFYLSKGRINDAESWLRGRITEGSTDPQPRLTFLRFLAEVRSPDAMRQELSSILATNPLPSDVAADPAQFKALKARADYTAGERDSGMAQMEALISDEESGQSVENDALKVQLAQMRLESGNDVGARSLVEEVLKRDPGQTGALKLKAGWLIKEDMPDEAIRILRDALAGAPNDPELLTILAGAYQRQGQPALMADMLARAVDASNQGAAESTRYATYLMQQQEYNSAETILIDAMRRDPKNFNLLNMLTRVHLLMQDWARATQDVEAIRSRFSGNAQALTLADEYQAQIMARQGRNDELGGFLDDLAKGTGDNGVASQIAVIRNMVREGKLDQALTMATDLAQSNVDKPAASLVLGQLLQAKGQVDEARKTFEGVTVSDPSYEAGWLSLAILQRSQKDITAALATVDAGLGRIPQSRQLGLLKAGLLEAEGKIDAAIAIYEGLYAANSDDVVVANNLASLLGSTRTDAESLERAWVVARRLNGTQFPPFLDTYGWLAFRRGDMGQALPALTKAAQGLPNDPSVAYHLGMALAVQGRKDEAAAEYDRASKLRGSGAIAYPEFDADLAKARDALKAK